MSSSPNQLNLPTKYMDLSGSTIQILIRKPFVDCSGFVDWLVAKSGAVVCCQHDADDDIKSTHCHIAVLLPIGNEGIRKQLLKHDLGGSHSSILQKTVKTKVPYDFIELAKYCVKGDSTTVRRTTLGEEMMKDLQAKWVSHRAQVVLRGDVFVRESKKHTADSKYAIVQEVVAKVAGLACLPMEELAKHVREALVKREMALGMYKVMDLCDSVLMYSKTHGHKWMASAVSFLEKRYG